MKKLGGYFCFKKTRIDGKTKGKMFGSFKNNVYFCMQQCKDIIRMSCGKKRPLNQQTKT